MKTKPLFLAALMTVTPLALKAANPSPAPNQRAEVVFVNPDKFTDVRDDYVATDSGRDALLDQIRSYMLDEARRFAPTGDTLKIEVTDIDLAGDFEPWRGPQWDHVRIMKDIYPPRMKLSFQLMDSSGKVVQEGTRQLANLFYTQEMTMSFQNDPLRYDKQMIDDWFRNEFSTRNRK